MDTARKFAKCPLRHGVANPAFAVGADPLCGHRFQSRSIRHRCGCFNVKARVQRDGSDGFGIVKFFNSSKGFGFIAPDDSGSGVFVHIPAVERAGLDRLNEGDQVAYELEQDCRSGKLAAVDLQWMGAAAAPIKTARPGGETRRF